MSYSFNVQAATKDEAKAAAAKVFDEAVANQPIHARDRDAALANINAAIDLLVDDPAYHISVGAQGCVSWRENLNADCSNPLSTASISASASLVTPS